MLTILTLGSFVCLRTLTKIGWKTVTTILTRRITHSYNKQKNTENLCNLIIFKLQIEALKRTFTIRYGDPVFSGGLPISVLAYEISDGSAIREREILHTGYGTRSNEKEYCHN